MVGRGRQRGGEGGMVGRGRQRGGRNGREREAEGREEW